jgi:hypothetical protein
MKKCHVVKGREIELVGGQVVLLKDFKTCGSGKRLLKIVKEDPVVRLVRINGINIDTSKDLTELPVGFCVENRVLTIMTHDKQCWVLTPGADGCYGFINIDGIANGKDLTKFGSLQKDNSHYVDLKKRIVYTEDKLILKDEYEVDWSSFTSLCTSYRPVNFVHKKTQKTVKIWHNGQIHEGFKDPGLKINELATSVMNNY